MLIFKERTAHFPIGNGRLGLFGFIRNIEQHIPHAAGEDAAEIIECCGGNIAVVLERVQRAAAERVVFDQSVGRDVPLLHRLP